MSRMIKRAQRKLADRLFEGEQVVGALFVETAGTYALGALGLVLARNAGQSALERRARQRTEDMVGIARTFPTGSAMVIATTSRILVVESNGWSFKRTVLELRRGDVMVGDVASRGFARRVQLVFRDGSHVRVDAQRGQNIDAFADIVGRSGV